MSVPDLARLTSPQARLRSLTVGCLVAALVLVAAELVLRATGLPRSAVLEHERAPLVIRPNVVGDDWRGHHLFADDYFFLDPVTREAPEDSALWVPRPGQPPFNEDGVVGIPLELPRALGVLRVLAVGDSNTLADGRAGWVEQLTDQWPGGKPCSKVEVINGGVHGYSSWQGRQRLARLLRAEPDVVTISFGWNDPLWVRTIPDAEYGVALSEWLASGDTASWWSGLAITSVLRTGLAMARGISAKPRLRVTQAEFVENHRAMVAATKEAGAVPVLLTRPFDPETWADVYRSEDPHGQRVRDYAQAIRELAVELDVPLLDAASLASKFEQGTEYLDSCHFSEAGHRVLSAALATLLAELPACSPAGPVEVR